PTIAHSWSAIVMHDAYASPTLDRVREGGVVMLNTSVVRRELDPERFVVIELAAADIAEGAGNRMAASMVMVGAYAAATDILSLDSLGEAVAASLPPYRRALAEVNVAALRAGFDAAPRLIAPAWELDQVAR